MTESTKFLVVNNMCHDINPPQSGHKYMVKITTNRGTMQGTLTASWKVGIQTILARKFKLPVPEPRSQPPNCARQKNRDENF